MLVSYTKKKCVFDLVDSPWLPTEDALPILEEVLDWDMESRVLSAGRAVNWTP